MIAIGIILAAFALSVGLNYWDHRRGLARQRTWVEGRKR